MVILNLKSYSESTNTNLKSILELISDLISTNSTLKDEIFVAPNLMDLFWAKQNYPNINFVAQHVDSISAGAFTGFLPAPLLLQMGVEYTLFNHSEHRIESLNLISNLEFIHNTGLKTIVCCENEIEVTEILRTKPFAIAYEPKDLIGSGVSVTSRPESVERFITQVKDIAIPIIGAGVSNGQDVQKALELGAKGVLIASAFVKAENKKQKLLELLLVSSTLSS